MSITLTITGRKSVLQTEFNPPLILDDNYEGGLLYFSTFNTIPNIDISNNIFAYGKNKQIKIPHGTYDLTDLHDYLKTELKDVQLQIKSNNNTSKCLLFCTEPIHFEAKNSIASFLGFSHTVLEPNKWHESVYPVDIIPASVIRIECDLVQGSYTNGLPTHIIHEFVLNVPPSQQIIEVPKNIIYFPITKKHITSIIVKILDLKGAPINFKNENIYMSLHLRKTK